jgi:hypothetical protein
LIQSAYEIAKVLPTAYWPERNNQLTDSWRLAREDEFTAIQTGEATLEAFKTPEGAAGALEAVCVARAENEDERDWLDEVETPSVV